MAIGEKAKEWGCIATAVAVFLLVTGLTLWSFRLAPVESVDAFYRAEWILEHWQDIPPRTALCAYPLCLRADTEKKRAGGNPGHMSETYYHLCPIHAAPFPQSGSRLD